MGNNKLLGIALVIAGALALAYGGFSYTRETHQAKIGPMEFSVNERKTVNVPLWAGVASIVIGGVLLLGGARRS